MSVGQIVIPGIVQDGVVLPQKDFSLPNGAHVEIVVRSPEVTPALAAEFAAWEKAGDEAWKMIEVWEEENQ